MKNYRIIGHPLNFCLTTPVMNGGFKALGLEARFETTDIELEALPEVDRKSTRLNSSHNSESRMPSSA
jgi:shikimate 5-dehydrogenase